MEQYTIMSNLEVRGVPVTSDEDVYTILKSVAKALQVPFNNEDISTAHRLQAPKDRNFHASIVVQFARRSVGASWLTPAKKKKLQTTDLHSSLRPAPVFVVEHLSPHNRELLQEAKSMVRENKLAYACCSNGKILVWKKAADQFNEYYANVGSNLVNAIPPVTEMVVNDEDYQIDSVFQFSPVSLEQLEKSVL
ncbi:hypothetical protein J6590_077069 [Homalodisca vitripennis]|nr:hypothetical protein J6590_077069 [Homalodisca vitripennis]